MVTKNGVEGNEKLNRNISGYFEPQLSQKTIKSILATEMSKMTYRTYMGPAKDRAYWYADKRT